MSLFDRLERLPVRPEFRERFERTLAARGAIEFPRAELADDAGEALEARLETRAALVRAMRPARRPWALAAVVLLSALSFLYIYAPELPDPPPPVAERTGLNEEAAQVRLAEEARLRGSARAAERERLRRVLDGAEPARLEDERRLWPAARTPDQRRAALAALARLGAADELYHIALEDRDARGHALYALVKTANSAETIHRALTHRRLRDDMIVMIRETPSAVALEGLRLALPEADVAVIRLVGEFGDRASIPLLEALANARRPRVTPATIDTSVNLESFVRCDDRMRAARDALRRLGAF